MNKLTLQLSALLIVLAACLGSVHALFAAPPRQASGITLRITDSATGLSNAEGRGEDKATMSVIAEGVDDMAGIQFKIEFDNLVVSVPEGGLTQGDLPEGFLFQSNVNNAEGFVKIIVAGARAVNVGNLTLADITFDLKGAPGQSTDLAFTEMLAGDPSFPPQRISVATVDGAIRILPLVPTPTPIPTPTPQREGGLCSATSASTVDGFWVVLGLALPAWTLVRRRRLP